MIENLSPRTQPTKRNPFARLRGAATRQLNTMEQYPMVESLRIGRRKKEERSSSQAAGVQRGMVDWLRSAQAAIGWAVIVIIVGAAVGVYVQRVSQTAITGRHAEQMFIKLKQLEFENSLRRQEISNEQEIYRMLSKSSDAGGNNQFVAPSSADSIYLAVEIPSPAVTAAEPAPETVAPPESIGEVLRLLLSETFGPLGRGVSNGE